MSSIRKTADLVRQLAQEHLGPLADLDPALVARIDAILDDQPTGRHARLAIEAAGITISDRHLRARWNAAMQRRLRWMVAAAAANGETPLILAHGCDQKDLPR